VNVTVMITVTHVVWYVNNETGPNNPPGSDGRSTDAYETLAQAAAVSLDNHYLYVFEGTSATTPLVGGIALKNGQKLWGQGVDLDLPGFPNLVLASANAPRVQTTVANTDVVTVPALTGPRQNVELQGLDLEATGATSSAIDVTSTGGHVVGVTIARNAIRGATGEGIDLNAGSTGAFTATLIGNGIVSTGTGIDLRTTGGPATVTASASVITSTAGHGIDLRTIAGASTLHVAVATSAITAAGTGIIIDGTAGGTTTVTGFAGNAIGGNTGQSGVAISAARLDQDPVAAGYQTVAGGTTTIGTSGNGVGTSGMVLTTVSGDLAFADLNLFASSGPGLFVSGTGPVNVGAGTGDRADAVE
jgi:large repetitive protein